MHQIPEIKRSKLILGVPNHGAIGWIRGLETAFKIHNGNTGGRMLEDAAEPCLALPERVLGTFALRDIDYGAHDFNDISRAI